MANLTGIWWLATNPFGTVDNEFPTDELKVWYFWIKRISVLVVFIEC